MNKNVCSIVSSTGYFFDKFIPIGKVWNNAKSCQLT